MGKLSTSQLGESCPFPEGGFQVKFATERLAIKPFEDGDLEDLFEIQSDEETVRYLLHEGWTEANKVEKFKDHTANKSFTEETPVNLAVVLEDKVIGDLYVTYTDMPNTVEIGYTFSQNYRGKGYAKEAVQGFMATLFDQYQVHRIVANLDARNAGSRALCERRGMRMEAHFIQDFWSKGEWTDSYVYAILASEFKEK